MKTILFLILFCQSLVALDLPSIHHANSSKLKINRGDYLYRGFGKEQYSINTFLNSTFYKVYPLLTSYSLKDSWNVSGTIKRKSRKINRQYTKNLEDIKVLKIMGFEYEYEFDEDFLYFSYYQQVARKYGEHMIVIKEKSPRGLDVNLFHYANHKNAAWAWTTWDWGEYVIPLAVEKSDVVGLHIQNSYRALYKVSFEGKYYVLYFDLLDTNRCITQKNGTFYHCEFPEFKNRPATLREAFPKEVIITKTARPQGVMVLCPSSSQCELSDKFIKKYSPEFKGVIAEIIKLESSKIKNLKLFY